MYFGFPISAFQSPARFEASSHAPRKSLMRFYTLSIAEKHPRTSGPLLVPHLLLEGNHLVELASKWDRSRFIVLRLTGFQPPRAPAGQLAPIAGRGSPPPQKGRNPVKSFFLSVGMLRHFLLPVRRRIFKPVGESVFVDVGSLSSPWTQTRERFSIVRRTEDPPSRSLSEYQLGIVSFELG